MSTPESSPRTLRLLAPAKINLHLRVGPRRADGFHPLLTWMATIGLFDTLTLKDQTGLSQRPPAQGIKLSCDDPTLPCDERNLVYKAAAGFMRKCHDQSEEMDCAVSIHLEKCIPAGGGLGGGSSNAASTLMGLNHLWNAKKDIGWLSELGGALGSDVPFFLFGPSSICQGRGEAVRPIGVPTRDMWVTLVLPPIGMLTADVYRKFDDLKLGTNVEQEPDWSEWASCNAHSLLPKLVNDLEISAFALRPDLGDLRAAIERMVGRPVRMSGSGSSLFTLFDTKTEAVAASEKIMAIHHVRAIGIPLAPVPHDELCD